MSIESAEIKNIARLARLAVAEQELAPYGQELTAILELVEQMQSVDTAGVEPLAHPLEMVQRLRPDAVTERDQRDQYQAGAPQTADGLYLVPKVIE